MPAALSLLVRPSPAQQQQQTAAAAFRDSLTAPKGFWIARAASALAQPLDERAHEDGQEKHWHRICIVNMI